MVQNAVLADLYNYRVHSPQGTKSFQNRSQAAAHISSLRRHVDDNEIEPEYREKGEWKADTEVFAMADRIDARKASQQKTPRRETSTLQNALRQLSVAAKLAASDTITEDHIYALEGLMAQVQSGLELLK